MSGSPALLAARERFSEAVQSAFDERRDPLASEGVQAWLVEHPEDAAELADLRASIQGIERADNPLRAPGRSRIVQLAAAALALVALGTWIALRPGVRATPALTAAQELELHPVVPAPELGSVQSWELVSTTESADGTHTLRASAGCVRVEHRAADIPSSVESLTLSSESVVMR
jgi:hypothetical protein